jgi:hypothetical protein
MKSQIIEAAWQSIERRGAVTISHLLFFGGLVAVIYGAHLIHPAAGWCVGGAEAIWIARLVEAERREQ